MSGHAKRGFDKFLFDQINSFYRIIRNDIIPTLPQNYTFSDVWEELKRDYPFELRAFEFELDGYAHQDKTLSRIQGKTRYKVKDIKSYFLKSKISSLFSAEYIEKRKVRFNEEERKNAQKKLAHERNKKNAKKRAAVEQAKKNAQELEPDFLDKLIGLYDRKGFSKEKQKDRVYILHELYKYDCPKITNFMHRQLNHEQNFQLREMMFKHLQAYGYVPKLKRKDAIPFGTDSKKKKIAIREYRNYQSKIEGVPNELSYQINNSSFQKVKVYDYFISHSYKDHDSVQRIISEINKAGKNVYCDWISDSDYLKRTLVCDATLEIIKKRIEQSKEILFVESENSKSSDWVAYELQYAENHGKPIKKISTDYETNCASGIVENKDTWYRHVEIKNLI